MGCAAILVAVLAVVIGLVVLPTTVSIVGFTNVTNISGVTADWSVLDASLALIPFAFLCLIIIAAIWAFIK